MKLQHYLFNKCILPLVFRLKGLKIGSKLEELRKMDRSGFSDVPALQREKYLNLVNAIRKENHYYGGEMDSIPDFAPDIDHLHCMPLLTKKSLRDLKDRLVTQGFEKSSSRMTAGTTGTPITVMVDKNTLSWQLATRYFVFGWHGIEIGDREARFWGRPQRGTSFRVKDFFLNRRRFEFCADTKAELVEEYNKLMKFQPDYFYGYSSLILNAALVCKSNGLNIPKLKAIVCTAESLGEQQRDFIQKVFQCPVVVEYGCTESDIIAFECEYGTLHIMSHNVLVENGINQPVLVYTDLNNLATPLIRYELGDLLTLEKHYKCACSRRLPVISSIKGRTLQQIVTFPDGTSMHSVKFAYLIEDLAKKYNIVQFKIVLNRSNLTFYFNIGGDTDVFESEMRRGVDDLIKGRVQYDFRYGPVPLSRGRKFSYFEQVK